jgi:hypothetical protein
MENFKPALFKINPVVYPLIFSHKIFLGHSLPKAKKTFFHFLCFHLFWVSKEAELYVSKTYNSLTL